MKKSTLIFFLLLSMLAISAQNKIINLEDIFKTRALFPSSLAQLSWQSNSDFTYIANQSLVSGNIKNAKADTLLNLKTLNEKLKKSVSLNAENNNYFISVENGKIKEELLPSEIIK